MKQYCYSFVANIINDPLPSLLQSGCIFILILPLDFTARENIGVGVRIGQVRATDSDRLEEIQYTTRADVREFAVFPTDGTILLRSPSVRLDFESLT